MVTLRSASANTRLVITPETPQESHRSSDCNIALLDLSSRKRDKRNVSLNSAWDHLYEALSIEGSKRLTRLVCNREGATREQGLAALYGEFRAAAFSGPQFLYSPEAGA
jgi:hypothetical protein